MATVDHANRSRLEVLREDMDALRGRLYELVEGLGLPAKQERAFIKLIRRTTYDVQRRLERHNG